MADIPKAVASILILACFFTRRRHSSRSASYKSLLDHPSHEFSLSLSSSCDSSSNRSSCDELSDSNDREDFGVSSTSRNLPKQRSCCGTFVSTPNSSQFAKNRHSRFLYKFPFLVEIFYWIITFVIYRITHILSQEMFSDDIWDTAQTNALNVLVAEQFTPLRFLLPVQEIEVQKWFMDGHQGLLTALNKTYALIHIPGTVLYELLKPDMF